MENYLDICECCGRIEEFKDEFTFDKICNFCIEDENQYLTEEELINNNNINPDKYLNKYEENTGEID
jgi:hypothetical protein